MTAPVRVAIVGSLLGRNPGFVTTQGEKLADLLRSRGHQVVETSSQISQARRLVDTVATLLRRRNEFDVAIVMVFSGKAFVLADVASAILRRLGKLTVMHLHGGLLPELYARRPGWARRVLGRGHVIVAQSDYLARATRALGLPVVILPNLVELHDLGHRAREVIRPRLLWMRAFHQVYGADLAVRAFAELRRRHPGATMAMAGQGKGTLAETRRLVDELGLTDAIRFPGFLDLAGKQREADAADVFLHTSRVDNTPVVLLEAAALGLPIVGTRVGGVPDMVAHEQAALLAPVDDPAALAAAVTRLIEEPGLAARLSGVARQLAHASAPEPVGVGWESLVKDAMVREKLR